MLKKRDSKLTKEYFEKFLEEYSKPTYFLLGVKYKSQFPIPAYKFKVCNKTIE